MSPLVPGRHHRAVIVRVANVLASSDRAEEWVWVGLHVWRLVSAPGGIIHGHAWLVARRINQDTVAMIPQGAGSGGIDANEVALDVVLGVVRAG